jgi:hypothetical protein
MVLLVAKTAVASAAAVFVLPVPRFPVVIRLTPAIPSLIVLLCIEASDVQAPQQKKENGV